MDESGRESIKRFLPSEFPKVETAGFHEAYRTELAKRNLIDNIDQAKGLAQPLKGNS